MPECQKIKNGGLDQYDAETFEQQQFGTAGVERVNISITCSASVPLYVIGLCVQFIDAVGLTWGADTMRLKQNMMLGFPCSGSLALYVSVSRACGWKNPVDASTESIVVTDRHITSVYSAMSWSTVGIMLISGSKSDDGSPVLSGGYERILSELLCAGLCDTMFTVCSTLM